MTTLACRPPRARGDLTPEDRAAVNAFADFLRNPTSRCPICLADDHTRPSACPDVTDAERRSVGVIAMDVAMAKRVTKLEAIAAKRRG